MFSLAIVSDCGPQLEGTSHPVERFFAAAKKSSLFSLSDWSESASEPTRMNPMKSEVKPAAFSRRAQLGFFHKS